MSNAEVNNAFIDMAFFVHLSSLFLAYSLARERARVLVEQIRDGKDPNVIKKMELAKESISKLTIEMAFDDFLLNSKALAESTIKGYKRAIKLTFGKVKHKALFSVNAELINKLHFERSKTTKSKADVNGYQNPPIFGESRIS